MKKKIGCEIGEWFNIIIENYLNDYWNNLDDLETFKNDYTIDNFANIKNFNVKHDSSKIEK